MTAAAARKLQKEIENVLKKADDGISEFSEYYDQATAATSSQQKERLGEELKKSINKLQRFRAQIREWIAQNAVQASCKAKLEDARRRIENDMQRFKDFERELKTKAFSTCALARQDELELEEEEKMKYQDWLSQTIQTLNDQLDLSEADLEALENKKSLNSEEKARREWLQTHQSRHRWHIKKLEHLLRAVDNDAVDMSDLAVIRDSVDMYVEEHENPDYYHDETLYESFDLAEYEEKAKAAAAEAAALPKDSVAAKDEVKSKGANKEKDKKRKEDKKEKKKEERDKKGPAVAIGGPASRTEPSEPSHPKEAKSVGGSASIDGEQREAEDEVKVQEDQLLSEADEFVCKICQVHVVGCGPMLTSCSHLFCGDCIMQWFLQHPQGQTWAQRAQCAGSDRVVPCPVCKQQLNEKKDLYPVCGLTSRSENLLLWRMLSSLKIMCVNHPKVKPDGKCDWIGEVGTYQKHIKYCRDQPGAAEMPEGGGGSKSSCAASSSAAAPSFFAAASDASLAAASSSQSPSVAAKGAHERPVAAAKSGAAYGQPEVTPKSAASSGSPQAYAAPPRTGPAGSSPSHQAAQPARGSGGGASGSSAASASGAPAQSPTGQQAHHAASAAAARGSDESIAKQSSSASSAGPSVATPKAAAAASSSQGRAPAERQESSGAAQQPPAAAQTSSQPQSSNQQPQSSSQQPQATAQQQPQPAAQPQPQPAAQQQPQPAAQSQQQATQQPSQTTAQQPAAQQSAQSQPAARQQQQAQAAAQPQAAAQSQQAQQAQQQASSQQAQHSSQSSAQAQQAQQSAAQQHSAMQQQQQQQHAAQQQQAAQQQDMQPNYPGGNLIQARAQYKPTQPNALPVEVGDLICLLDHQASGWTYVRNVTRETPAGWVPTWTVFPDDKKAAEPAMKESNGRAAAATSTNAMASSPAAYQQNASANAAQTSNQAQPAVAKQTKPLPPGHVQPMPTSTGAVPDRIQAVASFTAQSNSQLSVKRGAWLDVMDRHGSGWTFGRVLADPTSYDNCVEGWFPDWVTKEQAK